MLLISNGDKNVSFKKAFYRFWEIFVRNSKQQDNLLQGISLTVVKTIGELSEALVLKSFVKIVRKNKDMIRREPILGQLMARYDSLRMKNKDAEFNLTSESENSMTHETLNKSHFKIKESFLEDGVEGEVQENEKKKFEQPQNPDRKTKESDSSAIKSLVEKLKKNKEKFSDEHTLMGLHRVERGRSLPSSPSQLGITFDENLLGKRESMDENSKEQRE